MSVTEVSRRRFLRYRIALQTTGYATTIPCLGVPSATVILHGCQCVDYVLGIPGQAVGIYARIADRCGWWRHIYGRSAAATLAAVDRKPRQKKGTLMSPFFHFALLLVRGSAILTDCYFEPVCLPSASG